MIGTLGEKSLHAALKEWYAQPGDQLEVLVDGYVIDVVRGDLLIEIQTGNFAAIKRKLYALTENHPVRLVYPIAETKWIVREGANGKRIGRRRSPKRGRVEHVFTELVRIPELITWPGFSLEVVLIRAEEIRRNDGRGSWRRKGWSIVDQRLVDVVGRAVFETAADLCALLPPALPQPFTNRDLSAALGQPRYIAEKMTYCLRKTGAVEVVEKQGRTLLHAITDRSPE